MKHKIAQIVVDLPVDGPFSYRVPPVLQDKVRPGQRAWIPFGTRRRVGYIVGLSGRTGRRKLKTIDALIDEVPLFDGGYLKFTKEFGECHACSWGEAIAASLPPPVRRGQPVDVLAVSSSKSVKTGKIPQALVLDRSRQTYGSALEEILKEGNKAKRGVLVLVPESSMIANVKARMHEAGLDGVAEMVKQGSARRAKALWTDIRNGHISAVVGTRSAVFAPVQDLGLIVMIDEENSSYKQQKTPFYHARRVAQLRAAYEGARIVYYSLAPSAELWEGVRRKTISLTEIPPDDPCRIQVIDMSNYRRRKIPLLSFPLKEELRKALERGSRAILFMNRKGFSTVTVCRSCGYILKCERCDTALTYVFGSKKMVCRHCNYVTAPPDLCPQCRKAYMQYKGMGVEKLGSELAKDFPQARITHYDRTVVHMPAEFDILTTTQAILRLQDMQVDILGVVQADAEINRLDFRSAQKVFSLFWHLRQFTVSKVLLQTLIPDNYCIRAIAREDMKMFYREELKFRRECALPPFAELIEIVVRSAGKSLAEEQSRALYDLLCDGKILKEVMEPQPAAVAKLRGNYRYAISVKAKNLKKAVRFIRHAVHDLKKKSGVIITVDVEA